MVSDTPRESSPLRPSVWIHFASRGMQLLRFVVGPDDLDSSNILASLTRRCARSGQEDLRTCTSINGFHVPDLECARSSSDGCLAVLGGPQ